MKTAPDLKILLVEDDFRMYNSLRDVLEKHGYSVLTLPGKVFIDNYDDAIAVTKDIPHLAILDIQLKGRKSGIDIAAYLRKHYYTPVVLLTDFNTSEYRRESIKLSAGAFVKKSPYSTEQLLIDVERLIPYARKAAQRRTEAIILNVQERIGKEYQKREIRWKTIKKITTVKDIINTIILHLNNTKLYHCHMSLKDFEAMTPPHFIRINSGIILNGEYIQPGGSTAWQFFFEDELFEIAPTYRKDHVLVVIDEMKQIH